ncbi:MAG: flagellar export chaperone FliS [Betaproteobacteria bacterium]|nr:flagellar export chaperone FliS [Betaproteobacteria bacterium]
MVKVRASKAYKSVQNSTGVLTSDPAGLAILLFERIVDLITSAEATYDNNDKEARSKHTSKVIELIEMGLSPSLDMNRGGEIAANLKNLYRYWIAEVMNSNLKSERARLSVVKGQVQLILSAFVEAKKTN